MMNRREAVGRMLAITGVMVIGADAFLTGCRPDKQAWTPFSPGDVALMDEIGETIVPATSTPGARAAGIGAFMAMMVNDCYDDRSHAIFQEGLSTIEAASQRQHRTSFVTCPPADRTALLEGINREERAYTRAMKPGEAPHYFRLMRELTLLGFFSSEIGCTQVLRYVETPGAYDGDVPYTKGDRAWYYPLRRFG